MKYVVFLVLFALALAALADFGAHTKAEPNTTIDVKQAIVRLTSEGRTFCSGTVINDTTIVTAAHCVTAQSLFGSTLSGETINIRQNANVDLGITAKATYADSKLDRALLTGDFSKLPKAKYLSNIKQLSALRIKDSSLVSCGYPLAGDLYCSEMTYLKLTNFMWLVHGLLLPGMSGGPTMLPDGTVVAVNTAVDEDNSIVSPLYNVDFNLTTATK